jgi:hypothetical protein
MPRVASTIAANGRQCIDSGIDSGKGAGTTIAAGFVRMTATMRAKRQAKFVASHNFTGGIRHARRALD